MALLCWAGDLDAGERVMARFRRLAPPILDLVRPMPYPEIYQFTEGRPNPDHEALRSLFLDTVDLPAAEAVVTQLEAATAPLAVAQLRVLGGAMARVPADATAFAHRRRRIMAAIGAVWERPEETAVHEAWVTRFAAALGQGDPGVYVNFVGDEGEGRVREAYPGSTWDRLAAVKRRYDPHHPVPMQPEHPTGTQGSEAVRASPPCTRYDGDCGPGVRGVWGRSRRDRPSAGRRRARPGRGRRRRAWAHAHRRAPGLGRSRPALAARP
jgi:hypothetical protein